MGGWLDDGVQPFTKMFRNGVVDVDGVSKIEAGPLRKLGLHAMSEYQEVTFAFP